MASTTLWPRHSPRSASRWPRPRRRAGLLATRKPRTVRQCGHGRPDQRCRAGSSSRGPRGRSPPRPARARPLLPSRRRKLSRHRLPLTQKLPRKLLQSGGRCRREAAATTEEVTPAEAAPASRGGSLGPEALQLRKPSPLPSVPRPLPRQRSRHRRQRHDEALPETASDPAEGAAEPTGDALPVTGDEPAEGADDAAPAAGRRQGRHRAD